MSEHQIDLRWSRATPDFEYDTYNRSHSVAFKTGESLTMSAAPAFHGDEDMVDPEEAFVASLASCHMLTFLAIAARRKLVVDRYEDTAVGTLERNAEGKLAITRVTLRPQIAFAAGAEAPDAAALRAMHEKAHEACFIANSVRTSVMVEPAVTAGA